MTKPRHSRYAEALLAADEEPEMSAADHEQALATLAELVDPISDLFGEPIEFNDSVQNASYFADYAVLRSIDGLRYPAVSYMFSLTARLVAWHVDRALDPPSDGKIKQANDMLTSAGFVLVPLDATRTPYAGTQPWVSQAYENPTWMNRFFDYY